MSLESSGAGPRRLYLEDPIAIRALAHPLRWQLIRLIGRLGRATTADAARELGISHGLASHHLRMLAKYGFVEQVAGRDNREKPWRLVATSIDWSQPPQAREESAAINVFEQVLAEGALDAFLRWQQRRTDWPARWREHTGMAATTIYLTEAELFGLVEGIDALMRRYVEERPPDDLAARPRGSIPVDFTMFAIPVSVAPAASGQE